MVEPMHSSTASNSLRSCSAVTSRPTAVPVRNVMPSAFICSTRRSTTCFSSLKSGMPNRSRPPM